jgi:hypothetical protein
MDFQLKELLEDSAIPLWVRVLIILSLTFLTIWKVVIPYVEKKEAAKMLSSDEKYKKVLKERDLYKDKYEASEGNHVNCEKRVSALEVTLAKVTTMQETMLRIVESIVENSDDLPHLKGVIKQANQSMNNINSNN